MKRRLWTLFMMLSLFMMNAMTVFASDGEYSEGGVSLFAVLIVPLIIALIYCFILYSNMKSVSTATTAEIYEKKGSFNLTDKKDTYTHTTEKVIDKSTS